MRLPASKPGSKKSFSRTTLFLWARTLWHQVHVHTPLDGYGRQRVLLSIQRGTALSTTIDLTALTLPELIVVRETVAIATEIAEPIVRERDRLAAEGLEDGDDSDSRVYRPLPAVALRKGALRQYDQMVLNGREDVLSRIGAVILPGHGPSNDGSNVANNIKENPQAEDSSPSDDEHQDVREDGGPAEPPSGLQAPEPGSVSSPSVAGPAG